MSYRYVLVDTPGENIARITLNRPDKRNALNGTLRHEISEALNAADRDPSVRVTIIRGAGPSFSAGYDLAPAADEYGTMTGGQGNFQREVVARWTSIWDLEKAVIA